MKAIILAAGLGTRLRPLTNDKPKTMVTVGEKPILSYQIDALKNAGVTDITICTGYQAEKIFDYCKERYPDLSVDFLHNADYASTNNMYSLYMAKESLSGDVFVMNADVVIAQNLIKDMLSITGSAVAVDKGRYIGESMKVVVSKDGSIVDISKTISPDEAYGSSIDVYKFSPTDSETLRIALEEYFEENSDKKQWTEVMLQRLFKERLISPIPFPIGHTPWLEVDDLEDLAIAEGIFGTAKESFGNKKIAFVDGDGTLFTSDDVVLGAVEFLQFMRDRGLLVYVLSNNTSKTPAVYAEKLQKMGLEIITEEILLPSQLLMDDLKSQGINRIYLLANSDVVEQFTVDGFICDSQDPQAVVLTYDTELTYQKLSTAAKFLHKGVRYFATHVDVVCPTDFGPVPDIGSIIKMLEMTTGRLPEKTYGKPSPVLLDMTIKKHGLNKEEAIIFGDRLYTDIRMGMESGVTSVLVLSGETTDDDIKQSAYKPDVVVKSVAQFQFLLTVT